VVVKARKVYRAREKGKEDWSIACKTQKDVAKALGVTASQVNSVVKKRQKSCKGFEIILDVIPEHVKLVPVGSNKPLNSPQSTKSLVSPISDTYDPRLTALRKQGEVLS